MSICGETEGFWATDETQIITDAYGDARRSLTKLDFPVFVVMPNHVRPLAAFARDFDLDRKCQRGKVTTKLASWKLTPPERSLSGERAVVNI